MMYQLFKLIAYLSSISFKDKHYNIKSKPL